MHEHYTSIFLKQAMFPWFVNRNSNRSLDKPIEIRTNQSESQSDYGQSISRTVKTHLIMSMD